MEEVPQTKLYVAMRSMDRRTFYSPKGDEPDFFTFTVGEEKLSLEKRVTQLMHDKEGVNVNSDYALLTPADEPRALAYATYHRSVANYDLAQQHVQFSARDIRDIRHDLLSKLHDESDHSGEQLREFRLKAMLFQQVLRLFEVHR